MKNQNKINSIIDLVHKQKKDIIKAESSHWFYYFILFASFIAIILAFYFLFSGFHSVDLFVNRAVMFNDLYVETGIGINVRDINETAVNIKTGEQIIIPNIDLYINGMRSIFIGFFLLFFASQTHAWALSGMNNLITRRIKERIR